MREFGLSILPSSWCEAGVRNIGFITRVCHHFAKRIPSSCSSQLGFELDYCCYLVNRTHFSEGKSHLKSNYYCEAVPVIHGKKPKFSCFFSSTLIGKNNSLRVERHELLLCISKKQAKGKDHNNNIDGKTTRAEL